MKILKTSWSDHPRSLIATNLAKKPTKTTIKKVFEMRA